MNQKVIELEKYDEFYNVKTSENNIIRAKCIIIAAGNGAFGLINPQLKISTLIKPFLPCKR